MVQVRCADGSTLDVLPVAVRDRVGAVYETTLRLCRDGAPFAEVGQRCDGLLRALAGRLDGDDALQGTAERGVRSFADACGTDPARLWRQLAPHLPREVELLDLRARDPDDVPSAGELRAVLRRTRSWDGAAWRTRTEVVLQAWGDDGTGVRAVLTVAALRALVADLLGSVPSSGRVAG